MQVCVEAALGAQRRRHCCTHDSDEAGWSGLARMPEALAIFHQLKFDEWLVGSLETPFARTKVQKRVRYDRM